MRHLLSILVVLSSLPTCAETIESQGDGGHNTPSVIVVDRTAGDDGSPHVHSIQQAVDQANDGDMILVKEGTYHETVTVRKTGVTIAAFDPCHPPVIDGADQAFGRPAWEHVQGKIYRTSYAWYKSQLRPKEFNQYGGGLSPNRIAMHVYEDGVLLRGYVGNWADSTTSGYGAPYTDMAQLDPMNPMYYPAPWNKQDIRIPGRFLYDEGEARLYVWSAAEDDPNRHTYSIPVLENLIVLDANDVTLRGLVLTNGAGYAVVVGDDADGARIEDCCFISDMYPIYVQRADGVRIARNFIQQKGMWERYWYYDCKGTVLWSHAIELDHYPDDTTRHTEIYSNVIDGYYAAILANGRVVIHDNILSHCMSTHINIDNDCPEIQVYRNVCHHVDESSIGVPGVLGGPVWVFRNLFYHCGSLNKAGADEPDTTNKMCYFYHNTFTLSNLISSHPYEYPIFRRHIYRNNIFHLQYLESGNEFYWWYDGKDPALGWAFFPFTNGPDTDRDLFWIGPKGPFRYIARFRYAGSEDPVYYDNFAKLKRETGLDPQGLQADPLFRAVLQLDGVPPYDTLSPMDYRDVIQGGLPHLLEAQFQRFSDVFAVKKGSPAVDRGTPLPPDWADVVQVGDGKPDIGAWEIGSTDVPNWGYGSR